MASWTWIRKAVSYPLNHLRPVFNVKNRCHIPSKARPVMPMIRRFETAAHEDIYCLDVTAYSAQHGKMVSLLSNLLVTTLKQKGCEECMVFTDTDYVLIKTIIDGKFVKIRPDLAVVCDPVERIIINPPKFIIEVLSLTTEDFDNTTKKEWYLTNGVKYYCTIHPVTKEYQMWKQDKENYMVMEENEKMTFHNNCDIQVGDLAAVIKGF